MVKLDFTSNRSTKSRFVARSVPVSLHFSIVCHPEGDIQQKLGLGKDRVVLCRSKALAGVSCLQPTRFPCPASLVSIVSPTVEVADGILSPSGRVLPEALRGWFAVSD